MGPGTTDVVIDEMPVPGVLDENCSKFYKVTIDPENRLGNKKSKTRKLCCFENDGIIEFRGLNEVGSAISSGSTINLPCHYDSTSGPLYLYFKNCGSELLLNSTVKVRQSGTRPKTGGQLGNESFDEQIIINTSGLNRSCGGESIIEIPPDRLTLVDSTLTITFTGKYDEWTDIVNPLIIHLNFARWDPWESRCVWD